MILGGYLVESNHRTFCQFFIQDSSPSTFFDCNEVIGLQPHGYFYCHGIQASVIAYYHFFLLEIDLLRDLHPRTMLNQLRLRDCPTLVLILLLYTVLTSKALRSQSDTSTPSLAPLQRSCAESNSKVLVQSANSFSLPCVVLLPQY